MIKLLRRSLLSVTPPAWCPPSLKPRAAATVLFCLASSPPLVLPRTMLVGGDWGMPQQEHRGSGREAEEKICRRGDGGVSLGKKRGVSESFFKVILFLLFHFCSFLSIQHYMRGVSLGGFVGRREGGLERLHPHWTHQLRVTETCRKSFAQDYFWCGLES